MPKGTLPIPDAETRAGVWIVELTPAVREEHALWLDRTPFKTPTDLAYFPTYLRHLSLA